MKNAVRELESGDIEVSSVWYKPSNKLPDSGQLVWLNWGQNVSIGLFCAMPNPGVFRTTNGDVPIEEVSYWTEVTE